MKSRVTKDEQNILSTIRNDVADKIGNQIFELWFDRTVQWNLSGSVLSISAPTTFAMERLRRIYQRDIAEVARSIEGQSFQIEFTVISTKGASTSSTSQDDQGILETTAKVSPLTVSTSRTSHAGPPTPNAQPRPTFSNLVCGASNQIAFGASQAIVESPGTISPLFVYGPSGSGKTHLLQSIWDEFRDRVKPGRAMYLTAEQFTTHFLEGLQGKGLASFRRRYRDVDVLLIDQIEFFVGKSATTLEFHYTVDSLLRSGKQLVFSAKAPATEIAGLGADLVARLSSGLVCNIAPPDESMRLQIAQQYCSRHQLDISSEIVLMLVRRVQPDARHVQGALNRIRILQQVTGTGLTLRQAEAQLNDLFQCVQRPVGIQDIEKAICKTFGLDKKSLRSNGKIKSISHPRMLAMWLARKYTRAAYSEIGEFFGKRAHTTVISANRRVADWIKSDASITMAYGECRVADAIKRVEAHF
jgi:chromosomal replication initiator protein